MMNNNSTEASMKLKIIAKKCFGEKNDEYKFTSYIIHHTQCKNWPSQTTLNIANDEIITLAIGHEHQPILQV